MQAYLWHNNEAVVEWLERQERSKEDSIVRQNVECVKRDRVLREVFKYVSFEFSNCSLVVVARWSTSRSLALTFNVCCLNCFKCVFVMGLM